MRKESLLASTVALPLLLLGACTTRSEAPATTVRDSAGIAIVENRHIPDTDAGGWRVDPEPILSIGTVSGDPEYQMFTVNGAVRLSDGRIAIANDGSRDVRVYDARGAYLSTIGGHGSGPGEFNSIWYMGRFGGDTLVVLDGYLRRVSYLHPDVGFVRAINTEQELGLVLMAQGNTGDGRLLFGGGPIWGGMSGLENGFSRDRTRFVLTGSDGSLETTFAELPSSEVYAEIDENEARVFMVPFSKFPAGALQGDLAYAGTGDTYEILVWNLAGDMIRIIRMDQDPIPITPADVTAYIEERLEGFEDEAQRNLMRENYQKPPPLDRMPAYRRFLTDDLGCLWVEEYRRPGDDVPVWTVFDGEGTVLGRVSLPSGLYLREVGEDYVLGVLADDLDVEYVQMFRMERPAS
jgi:hypothetical protein